MQPNNAPPSALNASREAAPQGLTRESVDEMVKGIEADVPKEKQEVFLGVLASAEKIMWDPSTHRLVQEVAAKIQSPAQIPDILAESIAHLINAVIQESKMPVRQAQQRLLAVTFPVSQICALHALLYLQQRFRMTITSEIIHQTFQALQQAMHNMWGITPDVLKQLAQKNGSAPQPAQPAPTAAPTPTPGAQP
jgi:hypothetical protein